METNQHIEGSGIPSSLRTQTATLGGGCFWCLEAVFLELGGVVRVRSGYAGGTVQSPRYREVCTGDTGHAEVVEVVFDPELLNYRKLLEVFFAMHDPTTRNRQGHDVGTQYRSVIYFHNSEQEKIAREVMHEFAPAFAAPIVTELTSAPSFYPAEVEHQEYFARNGGQPYCQFVIAPKVAKVRQYFTGI
jgi:peptide-methionine (S)-S-oxide reductase